MASVAAIAWSSSLLPTGRRVAPHRPSGAALRMSSSDREGLLDALWDSSRETPTANTAEASHLHLELDEDGEPLQARFTYVDEHSCIGCTYCATTARGTFFMEEDHGRARVFDQAGDSDELVQEAIDSCPVSCIHYVSHEDLVILEKEREGQQINNAQRLRSQQEGTAAVPPTQAKSFSSGAMRCTNCPGRGCADCPMFGVGENPVYLDRKAVREERRRASGEAQAEEERQRREQLIMDSIFKAEGAVEEGAEEGGAEELVSAEEAAAEAEAALGGGVVERDVSGLLDAMFAAPEFEEEEGGGSS